jgi:diguanylate cyclase (GGDEF)-like protein
MISSSYLNLALFFAGFNVHEGLRQALKSLDHILKDDYGCKHMIAFTIPVEKDCLQYERDGLRVMLGKNDFKDQSLQDLIHKELANTPTHLKHDDFKVLEHDGRHLLLFPIGLRRRQFGWVLLEMSEPIDHEFAQLLDKFFKKCLSGEEKYNKLKQVENLIYIDEVTELFNQRKLLIDIEEAIASFEKSKESFSIIFMDIDHFKKVNDNYGHIVGTKVLEKMGVLLKDAFRDNDLLYRYGGDEFVAIIPNITKGIAVSLSERILQTVKDFTFKIRPTPSSEECHLNLSISIGVAIYPTDAKSKDDILNIADAMMYKAKESGRGRVCMTADLIG